MIQLAASKFDYRIEFQENNQSAYQRAWERGILDDVCAHMISFKRPQDYWNRQRVIRAVLLCDNMVEFRERFAGATNYASVNGFSGEIQRHYTIKRERDNYAEWLNG